MYVPGGATDAGSSQTSCTVMSMVAAWTGWVVRKTIEGGMTSVAQMTHGQRDRLGRVEGAEPSCDTSSLMPTKNGEARIEAKFDLGEVQTGLSTGEPLSVGRWRGRGADRRWDLREGETVPACAREGAGDNDGTIVLGEGGAKERCGPAAPDGVDVDRDVTGVSRSQELSVEAAQRSVRIADSRFEGT